MDLFEYQGKRYFADYDIPVIAGGIADTVEEAVAQAEQLDYPVAIKAQVQVGGRGKAGGIKVATNEEEARRHAGNILGMDIKGHTVRRLLIERGAEIKTEYYASFTFDRASRLHLGMLSSKGGIDIERVAEESPSSIARIHVNPAQGLDESACREWVVRADLAPEVTDQVVDILMKLYRCYTEGDAELVEINPLIITPDGRVIALDAKVSLDDNASDRHPEWSSFSTLKALDEREQLAQEKGLQYIGLDGSIGIIANGAGLAMSTLDVVNQVGGQPANFLDIGGGANATVVANALTVINLDSNVRSIFINIFGGVTRCDEVARGIVEAMNLVSIKAPLVVRLDGTNALEGRAILETHESEHLIVTPTMIDGAQKAVALAEGK